MSGGAEMAILLFSCLLRTFITLFLVMIVLNVVVLFVNKKYYYFVTAILGVSYSCCLDDPATAKRRTMKTLGELFSFLSAEFRLYFPRK